MAILYKNNAVSALASSITNVATSMTVTAGQGALFPAITGSDYFYVTIISFSNPSSFEIVKVTARATDTFTIVRAQDGTTAAAWSANDRVELRITAAMFSEALAERQPLDADLTAIAALTPTLDNFIVGNGSTWILETPAQTRTSLGGTTVGQNLFTLTNPSAISFLRVNADNTVSALDAATFRTAIGAGTSSTTGTVTSVSGTGTVSGLTLSGTVTSSGSLTLGGAITGFLPTSGGTLTGALSGTAGTFSGEVKWGSTGPHNSGNPRSLAIGWSGGNYGAAGYGVTYTATSGVHNYAINDIVSLWEAYDGITVRAAAGGTVGTAITWTTVLDARRSLSALTFKGNTVLDSANYNSYSPTLTGTGASGTWSIAVTGNAGTATTLATARTINGTSFNGSANITTANWGTARTLTIGSTGKSVDGSANVSWSLAEIGALASGAKAADADLLDGYNSTAFSGPVSTIKQFFWNDLSASGTQARTFEIARLGIDYNDWNSGSGPFEVELYEAYYSRGLKKKYVIHWGYTNTYGIQLVEYSGGGDNNFQCRVGAPVLVSGDNYYLPVFVDVKYYAGCDVRVTTNRDITASNPPAIGTTFINASPSATNISDFTADSTVNFASTTAVQISGSQLLHAGNYSSYALPLSGGSLTGNITLTQGTDRLISIGSSTNWSYTLKSEGDQFRLYDGNGTNFLYGVYNGGGTGKYLQLLGSNLVVFNNGSVTASGNQILHAGNVGSYALPIGGGTITGSRPIEINTTGGFIAMKGDSGGWSMGTYYKGSAGTTRAGFGAYGGGDSLTWAWIGTGYESPWMTLNGSAVNSLVALQQNGNQVLHAGNYLNYSLMRYAGVFTGNFQDLTDSVGELRIDQVNNINGGGYSNQPPNVYTYGGVLSWRTDNHSFQLYASHTGDLTFKTQWQNDNYSGWRRILHESNYTSFAPSLTGSGASGTWGINITGSAGSAGSASSAGSAGTSTRGTIEDTRAGQRSPNAYDDYRVSWEFTNQIIGGGDWHSAMTMQGWHDGYAAWQIIGPASTSAHENFYLRSGVNTSWNSVRTIVHSGNITSFASGSISGYNNPTTASTANTIAYRTSNGDVSMRELILTGGANSAQPGSNDMVAFYPGTNQVTRYTTAAVAAALGAAGVFNVPSGYVSNGNPWGTSNSAFFPNGITTANTTNWIYGHCYLGNAPSNGSGAQIESNGKFYNTVSSGQAMHVRRTGSAGTATDSYTALFEQTYGNHSWGIVGEFRVGADGGSDRPSILFSSGYNTNTWSVGFGSGSDSNFRINRDHGHRNGSWGTTLMTMDRDGNVTFAGNVTAYSDRRLKQNIKRIDNALALVDRLEGVTFNYIDGNRDGIGLIAQDVEQVLPSVVGESTSSDGSTFKNVAYGNIVAVLIEAIKELRSEVAELKSKLN